MPPSSHEPVAQLVVSEEGGWAIRMAMDLPKECGAKAIGLLLVPPPWTAPWIAVSIEECARAFADSSWTSAADCLLRHIWGEREPEGRLIVRSSALDENIELRGHYESCVCESNSASLATTLLRVGFQDSHQSHKNAGAPACALIVQRYLEPELLGHLSNEYRHAQRSVDFLHEHTSSEDPTFSRPASFRLRRPVSPPSDEALHTALMVPDQTGELEKTLHIIGSWLAAANLRGHVEWVQSRNRLYLVQLDVDLLPKNRRPMDEAPIPGQFPTNPETICAPFVRIDQGDYRDLRKTRSHALLHGAGAFVPPIFVARDVGEQVRDITSPVWTELKKLVSSPAVIRFDVPLDREEWTNLPTILTDGESIPKVFERVERAVDHVLSRGVQLSHLTIVVHHFIAARASAWSEARPDGLEVRVDALWGLPDGLQSFSHDSITYSPASEVITPEIRYKDRFLDVTHDGSWVVRRAAPSLARAEVCDARQVKEMARITLAVANETQRTVRIMWFIELVAGAIETADTLIPWIVVELEGNETAVVRPGSLGDDRAHDLRRRVDLSGGRALRTREDLLVFRDRPRAYDLGDRHVLLQPDAVVVRDRTFLSDFAEIVRSFSPPWRVLYAGSMLAHAPYQLQQYGVAVIPLYEEVRPPRRTVLRKLVRDRIPERVRAGGEVADITVLNDDAYVLALKQKLVEEALEVVYSTDEDELREELADLLTVAQALSRVGGAGQWPSVEASAVEKEKKLGGFDKKIYLRATGYYRRRDEDVPGRAGVARLRSGDGVRIPLIPPLVAQDRRQLVAISSLGVEFAVVFGEQHVEVRLLGKGQASSTPPQLSLFEDTENADDDRPE